MSFSSDNDIGGLPMMEARGMGKSYSLFDSPSDRLKELLWGQWKQYSRKFWALQDVSFDIGRGEVVGLVGRNGAGKSTLLQMVCGTLTPNSGTLVVRGRVAALLELGAGFSPEFSGLENVYMNAAILGLTRSEVDTKLDEILTFADIGKFIHQPVKTYSSGMFMRLAFAVATSVEPDILVVDEALSVGDGAFARKSFDRIMALKDRGATILFCSHAMYHIQALCTRAMWMENGHLRMVNSAAKVTSAYETSLVTESADTRVVSLAARTADFVVDLQSCNEVDQVLGSARMAAMGTAVLQTIEAFADGLKGTELAIQSGVSELILRVGFSSDPDLPCPSVAFGFAHANGMVVCSAGSANDGFELKRDSSGSGYAVLTYETFGLLQGDYSISVILGCERGIHVYEVAERAVRLRVVQTDLEQGLVRLAHRWASA